MKIQMTLKTNHRGCAVVTDNKHPILLSDFTICHIFRIGKDVSKTNKLTPSEKIDDILNKLNYIDNITTRQDMKGCLDFIKTSADMEYVGLFSETLAVLNNNNYTVARKIVTCDMSISRMYLVCLSFVENMFEMAALYPEENQKILDFAKNNFQKGCCK